MSWQCAFLREPRSTVNMLNDPHPVLKITGSQMKFMDWEQRRCWSFFYVRLPINGQLKNGISTGKLGGKKRGIYTNEFSGFQLRSVIIIKDCPKSKPRLENPGITYLIYTSGKNIIWSIGLNTIVFINRSNSDWDIFLNHSTMNSPIWLNEKALDVFQTISSMCDFNRKILS